MSTNARNCEYCQQPLPPDSRFCEWCGRPVRQPQAAPPSPPPPVASTSPTPPLQAASATPTKGRQGLAIALVVGGALLFCLVAAVIGGVVWWRGQAATADTPTVAPPVVAEVATPVPAAPVISAEPTQPTQPRVPPASVVDDFVRATLGTVPGAALDYAYAKTLMTAAYAPELDASAFVPVAYGIQEGPTAYEIEAAEISGQIATVVVQGYWAGDLGRRWRFTLQQEDSAWKIAAISSLPTPGLETGSAPVDASLQPLVGDWSVEGDVEALLGAASFRLTGASEGRLRMGLMDEDPDLQEVIALFEIYLDLEPDGPRRWTGQISVMVRDPETDETADLSQTPIVVLLSEDGEEILMRPSGDDEFSAYRVQP